MGVLITGAAGFVGRAVLSTLISQGYRVTILVRSFPNFNTKNVRVIVADLDSLDKLNNNIFGDIDCIIHLAAVAHARLNFKSKLSEGFLAELNHSMAINLARRAVDNGVDRFIFLSSIGVMGSSSHMRINAESKPDPYDWYTRSKFRTENELLKLASQSNLDVVILRPPLVYGPCAPGNFGQLINWIRKGVPLPFGALSNKRTFISLTNLADLIQTCIYHPSAKNQIFLAADEEDMSTTELINFLALEIGKSCMLLPVPPFLLRLTLSLIGKKSLANKLTGSLQIDIGKARRYLDWQPPLSLKEGLRKCFL